MEQFYLEIRAVHVGSALASGALFLVRALTLNLFGARWPLAGPVRWLAWTIDTVLLTAALMLMTITRQVPGGDAWLTIKLVMVIVYIALCHLALRAVSLRRRLASLAGAVAAFAYVYSVARTHHPLAFLA